ncbi:beta-galactosidase [Aureococcus anophagefferens]|nr:beta-galactosidase [Aureococcus anophagefferens]
MLVFWFAFVSLRRALATPSLRLGHGRRFVVEDDRFFETASIPRRSVVVIQLENEFGDYGDCSKNENDARYMRHLYDLATQHLGTDVIYSTVSPARNLDRVAVGATIAACCDGRRRPRGGLRRGLCFAKAFNAPGHSPKMWTELWTGWYTHWVDARRRTRRRRSGPAPSRWRASRTRRSRSTWRTAASYGYWSGANDLAPGGPTFAADDVLRHNAPAGAATTPLAPTAAHTFAAIRDAIAAVYGAPPDEPPAVPKRAYGAGLLKRVGDLDRGVPAPRPAAVAGLPFRPLDGAATASPVFLRGVLTIDGAPADTYLDTRGLSKGIIWLNGRMLGRFWETAGPQHALRAGALLELGQNDVIVLDLDGQPPALQSRASQRWLPKTRHHASLLNRDEAAPRVDGSMPASPRRATQRKSAGADEMTSRAAAAAATTTSCAGWCGGALGACGRRLDDGRAGNLLVAAVGGWVALASASLVLGFGRGKDFALLRRARRGAVVDRVFGDGFAAHVEEGAYRPGACAWPSRRPRARTARRSPRADWLRAFERSGQSRCIDFLLIAHGDAYKALLELALKLDLLNRGCVVVADGGGPDYARFVKNDARFRTTAHASDAGELLVAAYQGRRSDAYAA